MTRIILTPCSGRWLAYPEGALPSVRTIANTPEAALGDLVRFYPTSCGIELIEEAVAPWAVPAVAEAVCDLEATGRRNCPSEVP